MPSKVLNRKLGNLLKVDGDDVKFIAEALQWQVDFVVAGLV
jgi:hypothetical protein